MLPQTPAPASGSIIAVYANPPPPTRGRRRGRLPAASPAVCFAVQAQEAPGSGPGAFARAENPPAQAALCRGIAHVYARVSTPSAGGWAGDRAAA